MDELLELLEKKENENDDGFITIKLYSDGSGILISGSYIEIFDFNSIDELKKYLQE